MNLLDPNAHTVSDLWAQVAGFSADYSILRPLQEIRNVMVNINNHASAFQVSRDFTQSTAQT